MGHAHDKRDANRKQRSSNNLPCPSQIRLDRNHKYSVLLTLRDILHIWGNLSWINPSVEMSILEGVGHLRKGWERCYLLDI